MNVWKIKKHDRSEIVNVILDIAKQKAEIADVTQWSGDRIHRRDVEMMRLRTIEGKTYAQIGAEFTITKERVRQILIKTERKVNRLMKRFTKDLFINRSWE